MKTANIVEKDTKKEPLPIQRVLKGLIITVAPTLALTIILAWIFYPERYYFFRDYVSRLGAYYSTNSLPNLTSSIIFTVGFSFCGFLFLIIMIIYFIKRELAFNYMKGAFCLLMVAGGALTSIPQDHPTLRILHGIGAALFIGGFGVLNFTLQMMRFTRRHRPKKFEKTKDFYWDLTITIFVFIALFIFAIFYSLKVITSSPVLQILAQSSQKFILIIDCIAIFFIDLDDM